jgi:hypothetical protein
MKNAHHIGWKNIKDFWCTMWSNTLWKTVIRMCHPEMRPGKEMEMGNAHANCPYHHCRTGGRETTLLNHFHKHHESKTVPAMGIWDLTSELIRHNPEATVADAMGHKDGSMWLLSHDSSRRPRSHHAETSA